jgi:ankyrin repeat protein
LPQIHHRSIDILQNFTSQTLNDPKEVKKLQGATEELVDLVIGAQMQFLSNGSYFSEETILELKEKVSHIKSCVRTKATHLFTELLGDCKDLEEVLGKYNLSDEKVRIDLVEKRYGLNQENLIPKLNTYLKQRNPKTNPEDIENGVCHGLTLLYCYYQFLDQEQTFFSRVTDAITREVTVDEDIEEKTYSQLSDEELKLEHLCNDILYLHGGYEGGSQLEALKSLKAVTDQKSIHKLTRCLEFTSSFPYDKHTKSYPSLESTLHQIFRFAPNETKFLSLSTLDHSFGIFYKEGKCFLYNPNTSKRPQVFKMDTGGKKAAQKLARDLTTSLDSNKKAISLGITVISDAELPRMKATLAKTLQKNLDIGSQESFNLVDPLHIALVESPPHIVLDLIKRGADVNKVNNKGKSPLDVACYFGRKNLVRALIKKNAKVFDRDNTKTSPLHSATFRGHTEIMEILLSHGANPDHKAYEGATALHLAAMHKDVKASQILLNADADIHKKNAQGYTALHVAAEYDTVDLIKVLLDHDPTILSELNQDFRTALHISTMKGNAKTSQALLNHGADPTLSTHQGHTPLHFAAHSGNVQTIEILLNSRASINAQDHSGKTPLHYACIKGNLNATLTLLSKGVDPRIPDKKGNTPLRTAILSNRRNIVHTFIEKGVNLTEHNNAGDPLLHTAVKNGYFPVVLELSLTRNIDLDARDRQGLSALHLATVKGDLQSLVQLLAMDADVNTSGAGGYTPLHLAAQTGQVRAISLLLNKGADATKPTDDGTTPILLAAAAGSTEGIDLLIKQGATINCVDDYGYAPLHLAIEKERTGTIMHLLNRGANKSLRTNDGDSILDIAHSTKNPLMLEILQHFGVNISPERTDG